MQRLAEGTGRDLVVQNLNLQTDGADLLGGFRPVELRQLAQVRAELVTYAARPLALCPLCFEVQVYGVTWSFLSNRVYLDEGLRAHSRSCSLRRYFGSLTI